MVNKTERARRGMNELGALTWSEEEKDLIRRTVAQGATDDEFVLFEEFCRRSGLDPLTKEAHFEIRRWKNKRTGKWERQAVFIAGIHGLLGRANREPDYRGIQSASVSDKDEFSMDMGKGEVRHKKGMDDGAIVGGWAIVHREGMTPFLAWAKFSEFNDPRSRAWRDRPNVMIEKVAKATALRLAYPSIFGNVYECAETRERTAPPQTAAPQLELPGVDDPAAVFRDVAKAFRDARARRFPREHTNKHYAMFKQFCQNAIGREFAKRNELTAEEIGTIAKQWKVGNVDLKTGAIAAGRTQE